MGFKSLRDSAVTREPLWGAICVLWHALVIHLFRLLKIVADKRTCTSVSAGGLIWGIIIVLIISLVTTARQQRAVSLVATLSVNGLYILGQGGPGAPAMLLPQSLGSRM